MAQDRVPDTWQYGRAYERYVGRWSREVAPSFVDWLAVPARRRWLDVGCGTGALCDAILSAAAPVSVDGVEPSPGFLETAVDRIGGRVTFHRGDASALPIEDHSMDAVVSGLVLNFVPDVDVALAEMRRVALVGGVVGAYVWDYAERMELMRWFWDAAVDVDPGAAEYDEGTRFPLCTPDALTDRFLAAGLTAVETTGIEIPTGFADFDDYWSPFLGGQGAAPAYLMSLDEETRARVRALLEERLPTASDGSISLIARAWAVRGITRE